jgi:glutathione peroxidase
MRIKIVLSIVLGIGFLVSCGKVNMLHQSAYDFSFSRLQSDELLRLSDYKGKVLIVVNTASECGFTKQYKELEELYKKYKDLGLVLIGVPSNDFGGQEPGTSEQIASFCQLNFGVTFPLTKKEHVSGKDAHPFYIWAKNNLGALAAPKWNFHKYVIDRKGSLVDYFFSTTSVENSRFIERIEKLLAEKGVE